MLELPTFSFPDESDFPDLKFDGFNNDDDNLLSTVVDNISTPSPGRSPSLKQYMSSKQRNDMAHAVASLQLGDLLRGKPHQRQESGSTVASSVVDSPYTSPYPLSSNQILQIANADNSPSTYYLPDDMNGNGAQFANESMNAYPMKYKPSTLSHTPIFPPAMGDSRARNMAHGGGSDGARGPQHDYATPAATPRASVVQESPNGKLFKVPSNDYRVQQAPKIELYRTESAAFQDELYNPADFDQSTMANTQQQRPQSAIQPNTNNPLQSPSRNLVNEIVRTAESVRSQSPMVQDNSGRTRSPFRHGSPLAPTETFHRNSVPLLNTAAAVRRQRIAQNAAIEFAAHQPTLKRQETKTISPKDAMLDYNDAEQDNMSLFSDTLSDGYQRQFDVATESLFANGYLNGMSQYMPVNQSNSFGFRAADGSAVSMPDTTAPLQRPPHSSPTSASTQILQRIGAQQGHGRRAQNAQQVPATYRTKQPQIGMTESTPEFPAHLTSMESSISDSTAMPSSQEMNPPTKRIKIDEPASHNKRIRPAASAGESNSTSSPLQSLKGPASAISCTSPASHPSARTLSASTSPILPNADPDADIDDSTTADPTDPVGHALPASAISARNAQAGPHKCTRINKQTGHPCNIVFSRPYDLTRHEDTIHNRVKHKVACEYCTELKTFSRADALTRHMRVVHPEIEHNPKKMKTVY